MAAKSPTARKRATARRRKPVSRARVGKGVSVPRDVPVFARLGMRVALIAAKHMDDHKTVVMSRKDAAILRLTHEGCTTCKGNGQIFTKGKDGSFTGSKPCPAKPTKAKAGRVRVAMAARFSPDKRTGLVGWTCPCGKKEKPKFRDAREATKALRAHEKQKHGGKTVGGAWYGQGVDTATGTPDKPQTRGKTSRQQAPSKPTPTPIPENGIMHDENGPDFSNPNTPLDAGEYAWSATLTLGPAKAGLVPAKDRTGSYTPPPGASVGQLLDGLRALHAKECGIPVADVVLVRYSLIKK
ncbi:hypothetical protein [Streptomyces sp. NBC_00338]|uniref:hypothetical protein n=1 Tax=Streptomyces sp. NBC_00338 TaxID=2975715 RepID=UPI00224D84BC|nr:hypothetical protein [Streptomyces sp. NBC_00338]MCX5145113.1 DUF1922 domain-containing protein [Streptomyces sp. NBC_00338]